MAAVDADLTSYDAGLKEYYYSGELADVCYKPNPLMNFIPKETDWDGDVVVIPVMYGRGDGISNTFDDALDHASPTDSAKFNVDPREIYGVAHVSNKVIKISQTKNGNFWKPLITECTAKLKAVGHEIGGALYQDGSGIKGLVTAKGASYVDVDKVAFRHLNVGARVKFGSSATDAAANTEYKVIKRDRVNLRLTLDADPSADTDVVASAGVYRVGSENKQFYGLKSFLLATGDDFTTPFLGMVRDADQTRLGGLYDDQSGAATIEEALLNSGELIWDEGATPDACFVNTQRFVQLVNLIENGSKYRTRFSKATDRPNGSLMAELGYDTIVLHAGGVQMDIVGDPSCPVDEYYMLTQNTWGLKGAGPLPGFLEDGAFGSGILRVGTKDSLECRVGGYGNTYCSSPGDNLRGAFA